MKVARRRSIDPITTEVIFNYVTGVADEMLLALRRASYSPNVKQRGDCSAAILGVAGEVIAQSLVAPIHLGSMLGAVKELVKRHPPETLAAGDMFIANDPYSGGGEHLPDVNLVAPVFYDGACVAFVANIAHHADIGGMVPGSEALVCRSIFQEGLRLPPVRVVRAGALADDIVSIFLLNSRTPDERHGDLMAQIAANTVGIRRLEELFDKYGRLLVLESMSAYLSFTEKRFRKAIARIPDGVYRADDYLDPDVYDRLKRPIRIAVTVTKHNDRLSLDFAGTDGQAECACNASYNSTLSTVYALMKMLIDPEVPANSGYFRAIEVKAPLGSIVNPRPGAAVGARIFACAVMGDALAQAMSQAMPEQALAGSGPHQHLNFSGYYPDGQVWVDYETIAGAYGARPYRDGMDAVRVHMSGALNLPVEALEHVYPLLMERYELRTNAGGYGRFRGGLGVLRDYRALAPMTVSVSGQRQTVPAKGFAGGHNGGLGEFVVNPGKPSEKHLPAAVAEHVLSEGDVLSVRTPGGGGFGPPRERSRTLVLDDLAEERIERDTAREIYGLSGLASEP